jgi:hypothetical protein
MRPRIALVAVFTAAIIGFITLSPTRPVGSPAAAASTTTAKGHTGGTTLALQLAAFHTPAVPGTTSPISGLGASLSQAAEILAAKSTTAPALVVAPTPTPTPTRAPLPTPTPAPLPTPAPAVPVTDATSTDTADWQCIRVHESSDRYNSPAAPSGAYGIVPVTWWSNGYTGWPYQASPAAQDALALKLYNELGWQPWSTRYACGL